ncbi:MAG: AraC family transcriptional regulator [Planctomycetota bacterium]
MNRAIDHVLAHLPEPLPLEAVARAADFSPFHFHRIFRSLMGETLQQFVKRVRLERAVREMVHGGGRSLTEIALGVGFASSSDFSRCFKQCYGISPSAFDADAFRRTRRAELQTLAEPEERHLLAGLPAGENPDGFEAALRRLPPRVVAYTRVADPFRPGVVADAARGLVRWAEARGAASGAWLGYMWDDPEIVALPDCRYDVGVVVDDVRAEGSVGRMEFPAMTVASVPIAGGIDLEMRAIDWLWRTWLPSSGYVPTDHPSFEAWAGRPFEHGEEHFELEVQIPVRPAFGHGAPRSGPS